MKEDKCMRHPLLTDRTQPANSNSLLNLKLWRFFSEKKFAEYARWNLSCPLQQVLHDSGSETRNSRKNTPGSIWAKSPALVKTVPTRCSHSRLILQQSTRAAWMGSTYQCKKHRVPHLQHIYSSLKNSSHHHWHLHPRLELPSPSLERHFVQGMSVNKLTSGNGLCILPWQSDTCDSSTQALHEETGSESNKDWALTS